MRKFTINSHKGIDDILFGMSPEEVGAHLGPAEKKEKTIKGEKSFIDLEIREGISYSYENNKLVCVSGSISPPRFTLDNKTLPFTIFEIEHFLKNKSKANMRFPNLMGYIYADLGIVLYPHVTQDIRAGIKTSCTQMYLAVCNYDILLRYYQLFMNELKKMEGQEETLDNILTSQLGYYMEECIEFDHEETDD